MVNYWSLLSSKSDSIPQIWRGVLTLHREQEKPYDTLKSSGQILINPIFDTVTLIMLKKSDHVHGELLNSAYIKASINDSFSSEKQTII